MSLVDVYDALKEAKVSDQKAAAAVKAIEAVREEARLRRIEERIGEVRVDMEKGFGEVRAEIGELRADMEKGFGELRAEIGGLRADTEKGFGEVRAEIGELRANTEKGFGELRAEMRSEILLLKWMCGGILGLMAMAFIRIMFG